MLFFSLTASFSPAIGQTSLAPGKPFVIAADSDDLSYRLTKLYYDEAFKRLGIPIEIAIFPLARRAALVEQGAIDGESSRVLAYADAHPELVRVEESTSDLTFALFTASPTLRANSLAELSANTLVEYRRGVLVCENTLKKAIPPERLSGVTSAQQGVKKLLAGRSDVYCDIDLYVSGTLYSAEFKGISQVRKLFDIATLPVYIYLARRHADLAPRLAATLKQMKAEGLMDRYRIEAQRAAQR